MQWTLDLGEPCERGAPDRSARAARKQQSLPDAGQPSLPGLKIRRIDRLFLALRPDAATVDTIRRRLLPELCLENQVLGRARRVHALHVSLVGIGTYEGVPKVRVARVSEAVARFAYPAFDVGFDRITRFSPSGAVVLAGGADLRSLHEFSRAIRSALRKSGVKVPADASFNPHMTLVYSKNPFDERRVTPVRWRVREVVLIHSMVGHSRHVILESWPLAD